jgi:hypothetical protein
MSLIGNTKTPHTDRYKETTKEWHNGENCKVISPLVSELELLRP